MNTKTINLSELDLDNEDLQIRCETHWPTVNDYAELYKEDVELPKPTLYRDKAGEYHIADGWHRLFAHLANRAETVVCEIIEGERCDALKHALGANASHGLRRTNKDKRRAVEIAVGSFPNLSARAIADLCKVSHNLANEIKKQVSLNDTCEGKDGKTYKIPPRKEPVQMDFWQMLNVAYEPVKESFELALAVPGWIDESVTIDEKLEAIRGMRMNIQSMKRELDERERQIKETIV